MHRLLLLPALLIAAPAIAGLIYTPSSGQLPENYTPNPWGYGEFVASGAPSRSTGDGSRLRLDTTSGQIRSGWADNPTLDRSTGFSLQLQLQVITENHAASTDRAGFSLIALSSDLLGIELGFWEDEVWAQNVGFTHGEGAALDTTAATLSYDLTIQGSTYQLLANGAPILSGNLRDYSAAGLPYSSPNFLFFGDNTFSAAASVDIGNLSLTVVPEPETWGLMAGLGLLGLGLGRRLVRA